MHDSPPNYSHNSQSMTGLSPHEYSARHNGGRPQVGSPSYSSPERAQLFALSPEQRLYYERHLQSEDLNHGALKHELWGTNSPSDGRSEHFAHCSSNLGQSVSPQVRSPHNKQAGLNAVYRDHARSRPSACLNSDETIHHEARPGMSKPESLLERTRTDKRTCGSAPLADRHSKQCSLGTSISSSSRLKGRNRNNEYPPPSRIPVAGGNKPPPGGGSAKARTTPTTFRRAGSSVRAKATSRVDSGLRREPAERGAGEQRTVVRSISAKRIIPVNGNLKSSSSSAELTSPNIPGRPMSRSTISTGPNNTRRNASNHTVSTHSLRTPQHVRKVFGNEGSLKQREISIGKSRQSEKNISAQQQESIGRDYTKDDNAHQQVVGNSRPCELTPKIARPSFGESSTRNRNWEEKHGNRFGSRSWGSRSAVYSSEDKQTPASKTSAGQTSRLSTRFSSNESVGDDSRRTNSTRHGPSNGQDPASVPDRQSKLGLRSKRVSENTENRQSGCRIGTAIKSADTRNGRTPVITRVGKYSLLNSYSEARSRDAIGRSPAPLSTRRSQSSADVLGKSTSNKLDRGSDFLKESSVDDYGAAQRRAKTPVGTGRYSPHLTSSNFSRGAPKVSLQRDLSTCQLRTENPRTTHPLEEEEQSAQLRIDAQSDLSKNDRNTISKGTDIEPQQESLRDGVEMWEPDTNNEIASMEFDALQYAGHPEGKQEQQSVPAPEISEHEEPIDKASFIAEEGVFTLQSKTLETRIQQHIVLTNDNTSSSAQRPLTCKSAGGEKLQSVVQALIRSPIVTASITNLQPLINPISGKIVNKYSCSCDPPADPQCHFLAPLPPKPSPLSRYAQVARQNGESMSMLPRVTKGGMTDLHNCHANEFGFRDDTQLDYRQECLKESLRVARLNPSLMRPQLQKVDVLTQAGLEEGMSISKEWRPRNKAQNRTRTHSAERITPSLVSTGAAQRSYEETDCESNDGARPTDTAAQHNCTVDCPRDIIFQGDMEHVQYRAPQNSRATESCVPSNSDNGNGSRTGGSPQFKDVNSMLSDNSFACVKDMKALADQFNQNVMFQQWQNQNAAVSLQNKQGQQTHQLQNSRIMNHYPVGMQPQLANAGPMGMTRKLNPSQVGPQSTQHNTARIAHMPQHLHLMSGVGLPRIPAGQTHLEVSQGGNLATRSLSTHMLGVQASTGHVEETTNSDNRRAKMTNMVPLKSSTVEVSRTISGPSTIPGKGSDQDQREMIKLEGQKFIDKPAINLQIFRSNAMRQAHVFSRPTRSVSGGTCVTSGIPGMQPPMYLNGGIVRQQHLFSPQG